MSENAVPEATINRGLAAAHEFRSLVERIRGGDSGAVGDLYRAYASRVRDCVRRCYPSGSDPLHRDLDRDDIANLVWHEIYSWLGAGGTFGDPETLMGFVRCVARHGLADAARHMRAAKRSGQRRESLDLRQHDRPSGAADPAEQAAADDQLAVFLSRLSVAQAEVVCARLAGLDVKAIAKMMNVSVRKVQLLLSACSKQWPR